jgi:hypothetical protein
MSSCHPVSFFAIKQYSEELLAQNMMSAVGRN